MRKTLILALLMLPSAWAFGQTGHSARSMGMAGAYQGISRGAEVSLWNPANLALPDNPNSTLDFLNFGASIGNNSFNIALYNEYFSESYFDEHEYWDEAAKDAILSEVPEDVEVFNRVQVTSLAFSLRNMAIAVNSFGYMDMKFPEEYLAVPLKGLGTDVIDLTNVDGEAIAGTEIAASYAREIPQNWNWAENFTVGGSFKFMIGHMYAYVEEAGGTALSNADSIGVDGGYTAYIVNPYEDYGETGYGVGIDLGAAAVLSEKLSVGLSVHNLIGSITFGSAEQYLGSYSFHEPGIDQDEFDNLEDYVDSSSTEHSPSGSLTYTLPKSILMSGTYRLNNKIIIEADYHQGLNNVAGGSTRPRLAAGTEMRYIDWLPTRVGLGVGGVQGLTLAFGFGFDLGSYKLDFGVAGQRGLFNHSKGVNFALAQRILL